MITRYAVNVTIGDVIQIAQENYEVIEYVYNADFNNVRVTLSHPNVNGDVILILPSYAVVTLRREELSKPSR